jgi:predicted AAA+ superfamily ATPase
MGMSRAATVTGVGKPLVRSVHNYAERLARQSGKTTLVKAAFPDLPYASLEEPDIRQIALTDPRGFLANYPVGAVFDEIQNTPDLFSYIQRIVDENRQTQFILTGSSNFLLLEKISQTLAGRTGQLLNYASLANDAGISLNTAKAWLSILESSFMVYRLQPYHRNFNKRLVKSPKLYFYDTGVAYSLLGIRDEKQVNLHYLKGALFENLIINEFIKRYFHRGEQSMQTSAGALVSWRELERITV